MVGGVPVRPPRGASAMSLLVLCLLGSLSNGIPLEKEPELDPLPAGVDPNMQPAGILQPQVHPPGNEVGSGLGALGKTWTGSNEQPGPGSYGIDGPGTYGGAGSGSSGGTGTGMNGQPGPGSYGIDGPGTYGGAGSGSSGGTGTGMNGQPGPGSYGIDGPGTYGGAGSGSSGGTGTGWSGETGGGSSGGTWTGSDGQPGPGSYGIGGIGSPGGPRSGSSGGTGTGMNGQPGPGSYGIDGPRAYGGPGSGSSGGTGGSTMTGSILGTGCDPYLGARPGSCENPGPGSPGPGVPGGARPVIAGWCCQPPARRPGLSYVIVMNRPRAHPRPVYRKPGLPFAPGLQDRSKTAGNDPVQSGDSESNSGNVQPGQGADGHQRPHYKNPGIPYVPSISELPGYAGRTVYVNKGIEGGVGVGAGGVGKPVTSKPLLPSKP